MIRSITIENFKGIRDAVTIPIRPITLLFGKNSAGKSTVIQALHYLREVCENRRPDPDRTQIGGDAIDLGGVQSLVHGKELDRTIRIRVELDVDDDGLPNTGITSPGGTTKDSENHSIDLNDFGGIETAWVEVHTAWDDHAGARITEYATGVDAQELVRCRQLAGLNPEVVAINFDHSLVMTLCQELDSDNDPLGLRHRLWFLHQEDFDNLDPDKLQIAPIALTQADSIIPDPARPFLVPDDFNDAMAYQDPETQFAFWSIVGQALTGPLALLLDELKGIRYVGAIRDVPPRNYRSPKTPDESRWARGLGAWDALVRSGDLVARTSHYVQDVLKLGYSLRREQRVSIDADGEIMAELRLLASQYEERDAGYFRQRVLDPLDNLPRSPRIQLHDEQQDIDVDPCDIGVGISQVLPVVVGALDAGTVQQPCRLLAVEQPELHVHPAVQVALGDLFIEAIDGSDRTMLVETHSEHLLLRLLRRVREGADGSLSAGDLSVVYVKPTPVGVELTPLPVTDEGEFSRNWPEGFFEERAEELF